MNAGAAASLVRRAAVVVALPAALVALWWTTSADSQSFYFPPLQTIVQTFVKLWLSPHAVQNILLSLTHFAIGYLAAALLGIALGVPNGASRRLRETLEPVLEFLRAIPPPVLVPVLILLAGIGDAMKRLVILFGCVWPVLLNTVAGVQALDEVLAETVRSYRIERLARLWHFALPGASPLICAGLRQALSIGIILMKLSDRMPVILDEKDWPAWLGEVAASEGELMALLKPCRDRALQIWPVSRMVGNVKNKGQQVAVPV